MDVLYLTTGCFDKGGISRYSRYQIRAFRERYGAEHVGVFSVLGRDEGSFEEELPVTYAAGGVSLVQKSAFAARVVAWATQRRPQLIYAAHVNLGWLAQLAARIAHGRLVLNIYGLEVWSDLRSTAAHALRSADLAISDCKATAEFACSQGLRTDEGIRVLWDCVDLARFLPGAADPAILDRYRMPHPQDGTNILSLGRMSGDAAHKGYERLLGAFAMMANRVPNARLVYAGGGDLIDVLLDQARDLGLSERVHFTGRVDDDDLVHIYRAAHIFSLVSDRGHGRGEGLPLTPLEAAACGVPIIVGNQDGSREAIGDTDNGFCIDPFDLPKHASLLELLCTSGNLRAKMGLAARTRIERHHSYEVFAQKMFQVLTVAGVIDG